MKLGSTLRNAAVATAIIGSTLATAASPAAADPIRHIEVRSSGVCDTTTGQWNVTWTIKNLFSQDAAISNVTSTPAGLTGLPESLPALTTATAQQKVDGGSSARLVFDATWADGQVSPGVQWWFRPFTPCIKAA
jgi:hypothetical protein